MNIRVNADVTPDQLLLLFRQTDFADNRDAAGCGRMLASTPVHVSAWEGSDLVGYARGLTDGVYIALVLDVVVDEQHRRRGIGTALVRAIVDQLHPVDEILLGCGEELVPFYEKLGWAQDEGAVMTYQERIGGPDQGILTPD